MRTFSHILALLILLSVAFAQAGGVTGTTDVRVELLEARQLQSRYFDGVDEADLLAACAGVTQDLGFNLDESESELGLIVASKQLTARDPLQRTVAVLLRIFASTEFSIDDHQRVRLSLVSWPVRGHPDRYRVRVTFQRTVWKSDGEIGHREVLNDPELYQTFFARLGKSLFLEGHKL